MRETKSKDYRNDGNNEYDVSGHVHDDCLRKEHHQLQIQDKSKEGIFLLFISAFLFSVMGLCLQFTGRMGIPSTELVFIRAVFQGTFVVLGMIFCRVDDSTPTYVHNGDNEKCIKYDGGSDIRFLNGAKKGQENTDSIKFFSSEADLAVKHDDDAMVEEKKIEECNDTDQTRHDSFFNNESTSLLSKTHKKCAYVDASSNKKAETSSMSEAKKSSSRDRIIQHPFGNTPTIRNIVLLRGIIGGFGFLNYYYTLSTLPLGDATTLLSLYPIVTIFLARFALGEPIKTSQVMASVLSAVGACLICRPSFLFGDEPGDGDDVQPRPPTFGYITALLGALCASCVIVLIRKAGNVGAHTLQLLFSWVVFGVTFSLIAGFIAAGGLHQHTSQHALHQQWHLPTKDEFLPILGICITGSCGHFLLNYAAKLAPATVGALVKSSDIGWAYLWQIVVLGQEPERLTWWGALCVCCSLILVVLARNEGNVKKNGTEKTIQRNNTNEGHILLKQEINGENGIPLIELLK